MQPRCSVQVIRLPSYWRYENDQAFVFQQFGPDNPRGPWILHFVNGTRLQVTNSAQRDLGGIDRGVWVRYVFRLTTTNPGTLQIIVNGKTVANVSGNYQIPSKSPTMGWGTGLYCTYWRTHNPGVQTTRQI